MNDCRVGVHGAVPIKVGEEELVNLTGSATILEKGGNRFLIDLGLFQGSEGSELFNKENIAFLKDIDGVVITHPHIDHIGRLPILYKLGYRGPIYMTSSTKSITFEMLLDSHKIQEEERLEKLSRNSKLGFRLKEALKIKEYIFRLRKNVFIDSGDKVSVKSFLESKLGKDYNEEDVLSELEKYLDFYDVKEEKDIQVVMEKLREKFFDLEDIYGAIKLVQTLDYGEEKIIKSKQITSKNDNAENQEILNNLPERVATGYKGIVSVSTKSEKRKLRRKWEDKLDKEIKGVMSSGIDFEEDKEKLRNKLQEAYTFCEQYDFLNKAKGKKKDSPEHINLLCFKNKPEFRGVKKHINKCEKLLKKYGINNRKDIERLLDNTAKLIDILRIGITFNSEDIEKASHTLEVENKSNNEREIIGLTFSDAAHIVGSASVTFTSGVVRKKVENLLDINGESTSVYFSGDLGRIEDNRLGSPEYPSLPVDFLQIESTYGGRDHLERERAVDNLIDSIEQSEGNVLISVFSQQRAQEILLTLLEEKIKRGEDCLDYEILIDAPLAEKVTRIYVTDMGEAYGLLHPQEQIKSFGREIFRFLGEDEWEEIYNKSIINKIKNIINLDLNDLRLSKLSSEKKKELESCIDKIKKISENKTNKEIKTDYSDEDISYESLIEIEFEGILEILGEDLYDRIVNKQEQKKHIILASSGMMDGGAIMNHLPCILEDPKATILAPGYLSGGTLGNQIVMEGKEEVTIGGEKCKVNCNKKFLDGFSSHIGHAEILQFITKSIEYGKLKPGATIALTHGSRDGQHSLKKDIEEVLKSFNREDVIVTLPELFSNYNVNSREFYSTIQENRVTRELVEEKKGVTPSFLLGNKKEKSTITDDIDNNSENTSENNILRTKNSTDIEDIRKKVKEVSLLRDSYMKQYLSSELKKPGISKVTKILNIISRLGSWQKKGFFISLNNKLTDNRNLKSNISRLRGDIKNISVLYDYIIDFSKNIKPKLLLEIEGIKGKIDLLNGEIEALIEEFSDLQERDGKKTKENTLKWESYEKQIRNKKRKVKTYEAEISKIEKQIINEKYFIERQLKQYTFNEDQIDILACFNSLFDDYKADQDIKIYQLLKQVRFNIKGNIIIAEGNLAANISLSFNKKSPRFNGRNLYKELYDTDSSDVNLVLLNTLIEEEFFGNRDLSIINEQLEVIKNNKAKKFNKRKAEGVLRRFFKDKQKENKDLGIDAIVSLDKLNKNIIKILKRIFIKEYFDNYISVQFDVYIFLKYLKKHNCTFKEYISSKYDLSKMRGIGKVIRHYDESIKNLDLGVTTLQHLDNLNADSKSEAELDDIRVGIDETKREIEAIIDTI